MQISILALVAAAAGLAAASPSLETRQLLPLCTILCAFSGTISVPLVFGPVPGTLSPGCGDCGGTCTPVNTTSIDILGIVSLNGSLSVRTS